MKRFSFWIIASIFTFLLGLGAVLSWLYFNQKEIVEIETVPMFDNIQSKSFPGLSRKISELQKGKSGYFPKDTWKGYHNENDLMHEYDKTEDFQNNFMNDWYGDFLKKMGEKSLLVNSNEREVYRFLWLRTFHHPIFVRVERKGNSIDLFSKESNGAGGYEPGKVIKTKKTTIDIEQWLEFLNLLEKTNYWKMPIEDKRVGFDGSQWILEGVKDNRYHIVDRWSPKNVEYKEACIYLLKLSGIDTDRLGDELY